MDKREIYEVDPNLVEKLRDCTIRDVEYQKRRLEQQGQIEPIPVIPTVDGTFLIDVDDPDYWSHSVEQVEAAKLLEWPTILVTY